MRTSTIVLTAVTLFIIPLTAQAGKPHRGGGIVMPQNRISYFKSYKVRPNSAALTQAQEQSLQKLKAGLDAIPQNATPTREQKVALQQALLGVVDGSNKPAAAHVQQLASDLAVALSKRSNPTPDLTPLTHELKTVMNSAYASTLDVHKAINNNQTLLNDSGADPTAALAIVKDLKAISAAAAAQGMPGMIK